MIDSTDMTAWSSALLGLYVLFAGIGALRQPDQWRVAVEEITKSPALQLLCGLAELLVGALVYITNPWEPTDIHSCIMKAMGGIMMVEALMVAGFFDIYSQFWLRNLTHMQRGWAIVSVLVGIGLAITGAMRLN